MVQQKLWYDGYRKVRGTGIGTVRAASESAVGGAVCHRATIFTEFRSFSKCFGRSNVLGRTNAHILAFPTIIARVLSCLIFYQSLYKIITWAKVGGTELAQCIERTFPYQLKVLYVELGMVRYTLVTRVYKGIVYLGRSQPLTGELILMVPHVGTTVVQYMVHNQ